MEEYIAEQMEQYDFKMLGESFQNLFPGYQVDVEKLFGLILKGRVGEAAGLFAAGIGNGLRGELAGMREVFLGILVIGILSALMKSVSALFSGSQLSGIGFYFLYLSLLAYLTKAFLFAAEVTNAAIGNVVLFVRLFIPTWFMAVSCASGLAAASVYYQMMLLAVYLVESFLLQAVIPFVYGYMILALLNGIFAEERLHLLLDFFKKCIELFLKITMGLIAGFSLVQSVIVPVAEQVKLTALRKAIHAIPGIGGAAEGMTELVIGAAAVIRNSFGVLLLFLLLLACCLPLCKLFFLTGVMKLGAALSGLVGDKRITACTNYVGEGCYLLAKCVFTAIALFLIVIAVVAYSLK